MTAPLRLAAPSVLVEERAGAWYLSSGHALPTPARCVGDWLVRWAHEAPARVWLQEQTPSGLRSLSYAEGLAAVRAAGSTLLALGASPTRPALILGENSIDHALFTLGAMHAGIPVAPVSSAYVYSSSDFGRLREVFAQLAPGVVIALDPLRAARALAALALDPSVALIAESGGAIPLQDALRTSPSPALDAAFAALTPDTVAKLLFTSGSTGAPKGVVNTQRMLCSNQEAIAALWPFLDEAPPQLVDWLPWSHTFGGNHNFHLVLRHGGTLRIDAGRPAPGLIQETARNLREAPPTVYFNVPRGFELLLPLLEEDAALRDAFFSRVRLVFYAAAALPASTQRRLEAVARAAHREDVLFATAWGSTETAPLATSAYFPTETPATIGLPAPGVTIKLAPVEDKAELRVRGPNVTPGYWQPGGHVSPPPLDEEGFLPTGDAGRLEDPSAPTRGIVFGGRLGENFKLSSGTWVSVGALRLAIVEACAPHIQDAVIAGHDRDALGVLLFPSPSSPLDPAALHAHVEAALHAHNQRYPASSHAIARFRILDSPPSLDAGEMTDKGYLNQRRTLITRARDVERLFL